MTSYDIAYYVMPTFLYVFIELVGIGAAIALYVSYRRSPNEAGRYIVSPKYKPQLKTPKLAFIPGALLAATAFATMGAFSTWQPFLSPAIVSLGQALDWVWIAGLIGTIILLVVSSRPID